MKPRDVFKIIVATVGLLLFTYGAVLLLDGVIFSLGSYQVSHGMAGSYAARGVMEIIFGMLFLKGFPPFVDLAFPREEPPPSDGEDTKKDS